MDENYNKTLGLHEIVKEKPKFAEVFKLDWIFNKPIEKIIISVSFLWSAFSLIKFIIGLILI